MTVQPRPEIPPSYWTGRPDVRIGDVERDRVCRSLSEHFAAGRLTADEFDQRAELAVRARTQADLHRLLVDLPAPVAVPPTVPMRAAGPSVFDVLFGMLGLLAGFCLFLLFLIGGDSYAAYGFFACLGGAAVAAACTHFVHRSVGRAR